MKKRGKNEKDKVETKRKGNLEIEKKNNFSKIKELKIFKYINNLPLEKLMLTLVSLLVIILLINSFSIGGLSNIIGIKLEKAKELAKPALIQVTTIVKENCIDCFDYTTVIENIKKKNVNVTEEKIIEYENSKDILDKYKIEKLPTVIVLGEINKTKLNQFEEREDALIFVGIKPPYFNTQKNAIKGIVEAIIIQEPKCTQCLKLEPVVKQLQDSGIKITKTTVIDTEIAKLEGYIKKYKIEKLPTAIFSKDISVYKEIKDLWQQRGKIGEDGSYIMEMEQPPYYSIIEDKTKGLVTLTYIVDKTCTECYDVLVHKTILGRFGLVYKEEKTLDINSPGGQDLIEKYNIKAVPTIILSKDSEFYSIAGIWDQVGTVESDGNFVFRNILAMGGDIKYKDLSTGKIVGGEGESGE